MTEKQLKIIKRALYSAEAIRINQIEKDPVPEVQFSEKHKAAMEALFRKLRNGQAVYEPRLKRKIAILVASLLLIALTITACVFKEEIKGFWVEFYDNCIKFKIGNEDDKVFNEISLSYIPEGYEEISRSKAEGLLKLTYSDGNNQILVQQYFYGETEIHFDIENSEYNTFYIDGAAYNMSYKNQIYSIVWETEEYSFFLQYHESVEWEEIEKMLRGIEIPDTK